MAPDAYLAAVWDPFADPPRLPKLPDDLVRAHTGSGLAVWVASHAGLVVRVVGAGTVIIGDAFTRPDGSGEPAAHYDLSPLAGANLQAQSDRLQGEAWGRYVLIAREPRRIGAFRDPSGALDCATWLKAGVRYFASRIPVQLDTLLPQGLAIDWAVVARQVNEPMATSGASALHAIEAIAPGALWIEEVGRTPATRQLWRPAELARQSLDDHGDPACRLRDCVRTCVATLANEHQNLLGEISGGLDSAIVAACVTRSARASNPPPDMTWVNYSTDELEGDESHYARAIAETLGVELDERRKPGLVYREDSIASVGADFRVGLTALDPDYDTAVAAQALALGVEALVTGQGGDAVFLQMATDAVLGDRLRLQGRIDLAEQLAQARRWRRSVWWTLGGTLAQAVWPRSGRRPVRPYLRARAGPIETAHPWLEGLRGLPSGKRVQVQALLAAQNVFGPSRRSEAVHVLHPLLSQPLVEMVLRLPSFVLTRGGEDRALARDAFASELPAILLGRRSKGSLQAFYGRSVADSLDVLRPWMLDGLLVREGLIDRDRLEPFLNPDVLIVRDVSVELLHVAAMEAWVRSWSQRIEAITGRPGEPPVADFRRES